MARGADWRRATPRCARWRAAARRRRRRCSRPIAATSPPRAPPACAAPLVDRLKLTPTIIETVAQGCEQIAAMPDPIGEITDLKQQPSGIRVGRMRVPLGVFGMIYESRPNVTIEAASLAIKSGNACILRGGSEALAVEPGAWRAGAAALRRGRPAGRGGAAGRRPPTARRWAA